MAEAHQEANDYQADAEDYQPDDSGSSTDEAGEQLQATISGSQHLDLEQRWAECESIISRRVNFFGDAYPFTQASIYRGIEIKEDADQPLRRWYRFLLLASSLQYAKQMQRITSAFEALSLEVFKKLTPPGCEVHGFWPGNHHYPTDKAGRITKLAGDVRGIPTFSDNAFHDGDRGDAGIDLVAWHPLGDHRNRIPVALAQCGCSAEDWKTKPHSVSRTNLAHKLLIAQDWWQFYFMPHEMRSSINDWATGNGDLPSVIVIDRARIYTLAQTNNLALPQAAEDLIQELDVTEYA
ncbi:hypothetical protein [Azospira oryzae]|uniref:hypothetical protein n=1 Tax=Azospira oryzae TaxID=146939 RepID=UPI001963CD93|nr:hypothetical protein [Azospira oryzae]